MHFIRSKPASSRSIIRASAALSLLACIAASCAATEAPSRAEVPRQAKALEQFAAALKVPAVSAPLLPQPLSDKPPDFTRWAGPVAFTRLDGSAGALPVNTEGFFACDDERLYLAVRCSEAEAAALAAEKVERDGNVWKADSLEFMVLPGLDPRNLYFQFAVDPAGSIYDARANDKSWNSRARTFAYREPGRWSVVLCLPLRDVSADAEPAPLWRVNLHRLRPKRAGAPELDLAWSPTFSKSNHVPARFGLVYLEGLGRAFNRDAVASQIAELKRDQVVFRQTFDRDTAGFTEGKVTTRKTPGGVESFLRCAGIRQTTLDRNFGNIHGLRMAFAYRTAPQQHGLVVQGAGTVVSGARPGLIEVIGRGVRAAQATCLDADHQSTASALGYDWFLFKRPYGH